MLAGWTCRWIREAGKLRLRPRSGHGLAIHVHRVPRLSMLTNVLKAVLGSTTKVQILRALLPLVSPVSGREAQRLAGIRSDQGVRAALEELSDLEILHRVQTRKAYLYQINRARPVGAARRAVGIWTASEQPSPRSPVGTARGIGQGGGKSLRSNPATAIYSLSPTVDDRFPHSSLVLRYSPDYRHGRRGPKRPAAALVGDSTAVGGSCYGQHSFEDAPDTRASSPAKSAANPAPLKSGIGIGDAQLPHREPAPGRLRFGAPTIC